MSGEHGGRRDMGMVRLTLYDGGVLFVMPQNVRAAYSSGEDGCSVIVIEGLRDPLVLKMYPQDVHAALFPSDVRPLSREHDFSENEADGGRSCQRPRCTIRIRNAEWQVAEGCMWRQMLTDAMPACHGEMRTPAELPASP